MLLFGIKDHSFQEQTLFPNWYMIKILQYDNLIKKYEECAIYDDNVNISVFSNAKILLPEISFKR